MKVIVAGLGKTGTKSIEVAMRQLGYNVYDLMENFWNFDKEWNTIMTVGCTKEMITKIFKDMDVVTDFPCCYFWEEIFEAFPDAKVILTQKSNENAWIKGTTNHFESQNRNILLKLILFLTPSGRRLKRFADNMGRAIFGFKEAGFFKTMFNNPPINKTLLLKLYRRHNTYVKLKVPKNQLLIYNVKQGWDPLCKFLNKKIPKTYFPNKYVREETKLTEENRANDLFFQQIKKELSVVASIIFAVFAYILYMFLSWLPYQSWMSGLN